MSKPISHQLDIYGCWIHLARTRAEWAVLRRTVKSLDPKPTTSAGSMTHAQNSTAAGRHVSHIVVWVDVAAALDEYDLLDTVAHEACHAATGLLEHVEQPLRNDEALCYLMGWVTSWLWRGCRES